VGRSTTGGDGGRRRGGKRRSVGAGEGELEKENKEKKIIKKK
jgi:hypothetical protein